MALADYVNSKPVIHTPRLCLRPMNAGDVPALREWIWNGGIIRNDTFLF